MGKILLSALAAATIQSGAMFSESVAAMPSATVLTPRVTANAAPIREAAIVCGGNGCAPAQTTAVRKRKLIPLGHG